MSGLTEFVTLTTENVSSFQFKDLKVLKNVRGTYYACLMIIIVALFVHCFAPTTMQNTFILKYLWLPPSFPPPARTLL